MTNRSSIFRNILTGIIIIFLLFWLPLPYAVVQPGSAEPLHPMVETPHRSDEADGVFMLTTIRMTYPHSNMVSILYGYLSRYAHVISIDELFQGETEREYSNRQSHVMLTSQSNAIQAAFRLAGIPYEIETNDVVILRTIEGMPAFETMQAGDVIRMLDDQTIERVDDVFSFMENRSIGDEVKVVIERDEELIELVIELQDLSAAEQAQEQTSRPGLGIVPAETLIVKPLDPKYDVNIHAGEIGGPSAGLMFALEIYNRLVDEDITKGYRIAGTGTITPDGEVGVIGGIDYKVVASHRAGSDIFFTPHDYIGEDGQRIENASIAIEQAKRLKTPMKIVPVATLQEAIDYLASLPEKNRNGD